LMIGVSMVQLQDQIQGSPQKPLNATQSLPGTDYLPKQNKALGFAAVLTMCLTSGFAGVYFEKVLKGSSLTVWMQNVRLALLGIPLATITMLLKDWNAVMDGGLVKGYDWLVWAIILINSAGGLIIAVVMKYADNILKAYAQSLAIVFACLGSGIWFNFVPTSAFLIGTVLVIVSMYLYAKFPPQRVTVAPHGYGVGKTDGMMNGKQYLDDDASTVVKDKKVLSVDNDNTVARASTEEENRVV